MKKTLIFGLLLSAAAVVAQPKMGDRADLEKKKEKIEAIKVAYLTEELELTVAESQAFWPVYNERQNKEHELRELQRIGLQEINWRRAVGKRGRKNAVLFCGHTNRD